MYYTPPYDAGAPEDQHFVSIGDVAKIIRRRLWMVILVPLVLTGATVAISLLRTPLYEASATMLVGQVQGQGDNPARVDELQALTLSAVEIITTRPVAEEATSGLGLAPTDPDAVVENLSAEPTESGQLIELSYTDTDAGRSQRVIDAVGEVASEEISAQPMSGYDIKATVRDCA